MSVVHAYKTKLHACTLMLQYSLPVGVLMSQKGVGLFSDIVTYQGMFQDAWFVCILFLTRSILTFTYCITVNSYKH